MKLYKIFVLMFLLSGFALNGQDLVNIRGTGNCEDALDISRFKRFGPTTPPEKIGSENALEFDRAKHPAWYKFSINKKGVLLLDIIPTKPEDNYDFVLYRAEDNFCEKYNAGKVKALRSNFGPSEKSKYGYTGLSYTSDNLSYEKPLDVDKGDSFYLALNNEYDNGSGHTITLSVLKTFKVKGIVKNQKNNNPINAELTWKTLHSDNIIIKGETGKKGEYSMKLAVNNGSHTFPKYEFTAYADKYFPSVKNYSTIEANELNGKEINFNLQKIKRGTNNESLGIIYFEPNEYIAVPAADTVLRKLLKTMQLNPKAEIVLEGHTNGLFPSTEVDMALSENRAKAVKKYLTDSGIEASRIEIKGFGSTEEIYPTPRNEDEEGYNRRVEMKFTKF